jgi:hypothetical protein
MATIKNSGLGDAPSFSTKYLANRDATPQVSAIMAQGVSDQRRVILANEVEQGFFRDGSGPSYSSIVKENSETAVGRVISSISKQAQMGGGAMFGGGIGGNSVKQMPEVYSPLWLNSNLNLPRDRATINAWCRSFFALNPFVHNAVSLHSTYPISKLSIKCPNKDIEKFFNDMIEEIDLMNVCVQIAQEYWLLGEAFIYAEFDEGKGKWSRLHIQNPDFMIVKRTVVASEPIIMLRPDENLKKIIFSNRPTDIEQKKQLNQHIIDSVRRGENIPLDNFHVSHLARRISPYEIRGTGLPVCVFRQLMLFDKLRECYSEDTEVLTDRGFRKIHELSQITLAVEQNPNFVSGAILNEKGEIDGILSLKEDFKVACVNPETNEIEYHKPVELHMSKYTGKMIHFLSRNFDTLVSPNHKMWAQKANRLNGIFGWSEWQKIKACEISPTTTYRFQGITNWKGVDLKEVKVLDKIIPIELYLRFIGYVISEGYLGQNYIDFIQKIDSDCIDDMKIVMKSFADIFGLKVSERECETKDYKASGFKKQPSNRWNGRIYSKDLMNYFKEQVGENMEKTTAPYKKIPVWIKELNPKLLLILLDALVLGDGSHIKNKCSSAYKYYTVSKKLADDVQEIVFKCGFAPSIYSRKESRSDSGNIEHSVGWSDAKDGNFPVLRPTNYTPQIKEVDYDGIVWCFEVPTGLFITRRNGKIAIHGNSKYAQADNMVNPTTIVKIGSADYKPTFADLEAWRAVFEQAQYDKDFKIFTHEGVDITRVGWGQGIYDISGDITQLIKEIFIGLQVPPIMMDGTDTPYASAGVALDILRQRYMEFRNMLAHWLKTKIFAPISKIQQFYDYSGGEKQLIVPEIDWNHMSLFDAGDYIQTLVQLTQGEGSQKRVSLSTLYRSLGLEEEDENRKMRKENIQAAIAEKEVKALGVMSLNALRALDDEDEIPEPENTDQQEAPVPGESSGGGGGDGGAGGGLPDLGLPPSPTPSIPSTPPPTNNAPANLSGPAPAPTK